MGSKMRHNELIFRTYCTPRDVVQKGPFSAATSQIMKNPSTLVVGHP